MIKDFSARTRKLLKFDKKLRDDLSGYVCGVDEAGRGPLAGPVVAAAVIFSDDVYIDGVFDSKQVAPEKREELYGEIVSKALSYGVGIVDNLEIDEINILNATKKAMSLAISRLIETPGIIIVDGNFYSHENIRIINVVKADEKSFSVAAASIVAKVTRDRMMCEYQKVYPDFTFSHHKGYGTTAHIDEIIEYGYTEIHRKSFRLKAIEQLTLNF
jgi:ribonuclease HII